MISLQEFDRIENEENKNSLIFSSMTKPNFSDMNLIIESLPEIKQNNQRINEIKNSDFLVLIKKQINDMVYKDKEIGYNILLIDENIKFEEETSTKQNQELTKLLENKKALNEEIQKINQGLVKNLTEKSHTLQRYENSKQIFSEFNQKKAAKELRIQDIKYSITQQEIFKGEDVQIKKILCEDIETLKTFSIIQDSLINSMKLLVDFSKNNAKYSNKSFRKLEEIAKLMNKKNELETKKLSLEKEVKQINKRKKEEEAFKKQEEDFLCSSKMIYDQKIVEINSKISDLEISKKKIAEFINNYNNFKNHLLNFMKVKEKACKEQKKKIQDLQFDIGEIKLKNNNLKQFFLELEEENRKLKENVHKQFEENKQFFSILMDQTEEDLNFKIKQYKILTEQSSEIQERTAQISKKTEDLSQSIEKLKEDIHISKFDITLLKNQDPMTNNNTISKINWEETPKTSTVFRKHEENAVFSPKASAIMHRQKNSVDNLTTQKPRKIAHRTIKSMKLEINKNILVEKINNNTEKIPKVITRIRRKSFVAEGRAAHVKFQKQNSLDKDNLLFSKNDSQKQSKSPESKSHRLSNSMIKLKEENFCYSKLFNLRMRRLTKSKVLDTEGEINDNLLSCSENNEKEIEKLQTEQVCEEKNITKRKKYDFSIGIFFMLMLTLFFSLIRKEISIGIKIVTLPLTVIVVLNRNLRRMGKLSQ